jgi:NAD+ kinase
MTAAGTNAARAGAAAQAGSAQAGPAEAEAARTGTDQTGTGQAETDRTMLLVAHTGRPAARRSARAVVDRRTAAKVGVRILEPEAAELGCPAATVVPVSPAAAVGTEMVLVIGGDGTLLRAAELARGAGVPLLGVNLGHVGFLAEAEPEDLSEAVDRVVAGAYSVEERMTLDVTVRTNGEAIAATWALNEATVEKAARERMLDLVIEVDGRPLSRWGCDGVVFATPTGSTAYAFSAGGPVVWPEVEALLMVPICAHALFAGPMVVSPRSVLAAEVIGTAGGQSETSGAVLWCDGRRKVDLPPGARIEVRRGTRPVLLARLRAGAGEGAPEVGAPFTDRLVEKFGLPVTGWRGRGAVGRDGADRDQDGADQDGADHDRAAGERDEEPGGDA